MLHIELTRYNSTQGYAMGDVEIRPALSEDIGEVFRTLRASLGRCVRKIVRTKWDGTTEAIGWLWEAVREYRDCPGVYYKEQVATVLLEDNPALFCGTRQYRVLEAA